MIKKIKQFLIINSFELATFGFISTFSLFLLIGINMVENQMNELDSLKQRYSYVSELTDEIVKEQARIDSKYAKIYISMETKDYSKALIVAKAAKDYDIDPILLTALINSESSFRMVEHNNSKVKGLGGINETYWKIPNESVEEQIYATAYVFSHYLKRYNGDLLKALTAYKGMSDLGKRRAKAVIQNYERLKQNTGE